MGNGGDVFLFEKRNRKTFLEGVFFGGWLPLISVGAFTDWVLWVCCRCVLPQGCQGPLALPALTHKLVCAKQKTKVFSRRFSEGERHVITNYNSCARSGKPAPAGANNNLSHYTKKKGAVLLMRQPLF